MQNLENERTVIGCVLTKPSLVYEDLLRVEPNYFSDIKYREIYAMILKLQRTNQPVDFVTVSSALHEAGKLDSMGGRAFINDIIMEHPSVVTAKFHVAILEKNYMLRMIHNNCYNIMEQAKQGGNPNELIAEQMNMLHNLTLKEENNDHFSLLNSPDYLSNIINNPNDESGDLFYTLYPDIDKIMGGMCRGDVMAVGAYTSIGKSVFCECLSISAHHQEIPTTIFSLEMNRREYMQRLMSNHCEIPLDKFKTKDFTQKDLEQIAQAEKTFFNKFDLTIFDKPVVDTDYIYQKLLVEKRRKGKLGLVIVDHIHLMRGMGGSKKEKASQIAETLKQIARELDCYMIMVCQLKRTQVMDLKTKEYIIPEPTLNDFKESGDIENIANIAVLLHRLDRGAISTKVDVAKNRDGSIGITGLNFYGQFAKFTSSRRSTI